MQSGRKAANPHARFDEQGVETEKVGYAGTGNRKGQRRRGASYTAATVRSSM